jgi:HAD superfamily hydrolase (TIGR01484 family)
MPNYRALITDLDGTAIPVSGDESDISEETMGVVRSAIEQGAIIAAATGRYWQVSSNVIRRLGITQPCVIEGGSRIIDATTEETLWEKHLDHNDLMAAFDIFKRKADGDCHISTDSFRDRTLEDMSGVDAGARYIYLLGAPPDQAQTVINTVNAQGFAIAHGTQSWRGGGTIDVHVTHREATKEHALHKWAELVGVNRSDIIGMGDSGNDVPLFNAAGLKVAVSNATDELLQLADYIAPNDSYQALSHVIKKFL